MSSHQNTPCFREVIIPSSLFIGVHVLRNRYGGNPNLDRGAQRASRQKKVAPALAKEVQVSMSRITKFAGSGFIVCRIPMYAIDLHRLIVCTGIATQGAVGGYRLAAVIGVGYSYMLKVLLCFYAEVDDG